MFPAVMPTQQQMDQIRSAANEPRETGYYWAKLVTPYKEPEAEDWASRDWEIVEVDENYGDGEDEFRVYMLGVPIGQLIGGFIWGPAVEDKKPS